MDNWPSIPDLPLPSSRLLVSKAFGRQKSEDEKEVNGVFSDLPMVAEQLFSSHRIDNVTTKKGIGIERHALIRGAAIRDHR